MSELKKKCLCPTCQVPVQVKGLHKNLTFSTLVACTSQLKDLLELRLAQDRAKALLLPQSTQASEMDETQLPEVYHRPSSPARNVLDALASIADVSDTDLEGEREEHIQEQIADSIEPQQEQQASLDPLNSAPLEEPKSKRLARRSAKSTPKTTPMAKEATRMKQPASAPILKPKGIIVAPKEEPATVVVKEHLKILMSGLKPDDKALVTDYCKELDRGVRVQIASDYDSKTVNRIIMNVNDDGLCTRTTKYLRGILDGKTIVTFTCKAYLFILHFTNG